MRLVVSTSTSRELGACLAWAALSVSGLSWCGWHVLQVQPHTTVKTQLKGPQTQDPLWVEKPVRCPAWRASEPRLQGRTHSPIRSMPLRVNSTDQVGENFDSDSQSEKRKGIHPPSQETKLLSPRFTNILTGQQARSRPLSQGSSGEGWGWEAQGAAGPRPPSCRLSLQQMWAPQPSLVSEVTRVPKSSLRHL